MTATQRRPAALAEAFTLPVDLHHAILDRMSTAGLGTDGAFALVQFDADGLRGAAVETRSGRHGEEREDTSLRPVDLDYAIADHLVRDARAARPEHAEQVRELLALVAEARTRLASADGTFVMGREYYGLLRVSRGDLAECLAPHVDRVREFSRSILLTSPLSPTCVVLTPEHVQWPGLDAALAQAGVPTIALGEQASPRGSRHRRGADVDEAPRATSPTSSREPSSVEFAAQPDAQPPGARPGVLQHTADHHELLPTRPPEPPMFVDDTPTDVLPPIRLAPVVRGGFAPLAGSPDDPMLGAPPRQSTGRGFVGVASGPAYTSYPARIAPPRSVVMSGPLSPVLDLPEEPDVAVAEVRRRRTNRYVLSAAAAVALVAIGAAAVMTAPWSPTSAPEQPSATRTYTPPTADPPVPVKATTQRPTQLPPMTPGDAYDYGPPPKPSTAERAPSSAPRIECPPPIRIPGFPPIALC